MNYLDSVKLTKENYWAAVPKPKLDVLFQQYLSGKWNVFSIMQDDKQDEITSGLAEIALKYMAGVK